MRIFGTQKLWLFTQHYVILRGLDLFFPSSGSTFTSKTWQSENTIIFQENKAKPDLIAST